MHPLDKIKEWRNGCSVSMMTDGKHPGECVECTSALIDSIEKWFEEPVEAQTVKNVDPHPIQVTHQRIEELKTEQDALYKVIRSGRPIPNPLQVQDRVNDIGVRLNTLYETAIRQLMREAADRLGKGANATDNDIFIGRREMTFADVPPVRKDHGEAPPLHLRDRDPLRHPGETSWNQRHHHSRHPIGSDQVAETGDAFWSVRPAEPRTDPVGKGHGTDFDPDPARDRDERYAVLSQAKALYLPTSLGILHEIDNLAAFEILSNHPDLYVQMMNDETGVIARRK